MVGKYHYLVILYINLVYTVYILDLLLLITSLCHSNFMFNCSCIVSSLISIIFILCTSNFVTFSILLISAALTLVTRTFLQKWNYLSVLSERFLEIMLFRGLVSVGDHFIKMFDVFLTSKQRKSKIISAH